MAAVLAAQPAVASHATAGWLWGLLRSRPSSFHLTAPSRRHRMPGWTVHFADLPPEDRGTAEGIPATALPRTLLDLAATGSARRLEAALERSEELGLFDLVRRHGLPRPSMNFVAAGIELVRITDVRLAREPAATMGRLSTLLEQRGREPGAFN